MSLRVYIDGYGTLIEQKTKGKTKVDLTYEEDLVTITLRRGNASLTSSELTHEQAMERLCWFWFGLDDQPKPNWLLFFATMIARLGLGYLIYIVLGAQPSLAVLMSIAANVLYMAAAGDFHSTRSKYV